MLPNYSSKKTERSWIATYILQSLHQLSDYSANELIRSYCEHHEINNESAIPARSTFCTFIITMRHAHGVYRIKLLRLM